MSEPTGAEVLGWLREAWDKIHNPPAPQPVCKCGSTTVEQNHGWLHPGRPNGLYCHQGHYLPGQDMPSSR